MLQPQRGEFDFSDADALVDFAQANDNANLRDSVWSQLGETYIGAAGGQADRSAV